MQLFDPSETTNDLDKLLRKDGFNPDDPKVRRHQADHQPILREANGRGVGACERGVKEIYGRKRRLMSCWNLRRGLFVFSQTESTAMRQQQNAPKAEVVGWEQGELGVVEHFKHGWHGYTVESRDEAYAELERIEPGRKRGARRARSSYERY